MSQRCPSCKFPVPDAQWEEGVCGWCEADVHAVVEEAATDEEPEVIRIDDLEEERTANASMWPIIVPIAGLAILFLALWVPLDPDRGKEETESSSRKSPTIDPEQYAKALAAKAKAAKARLKSSSSPATTDQSNPAKGGATAEAVKVTRVIRFDGKPIVIEAEAAKRVGNEMKAYREGTVGYVSTKQRAGGDHTDHARTPAKGRLPIRLQVERPMQIRLFGHMKSPTGTDSDNSFFVAAVSGKSSQASKYTPLHAAAKKEWIWAPSQVLDLAAGVNTIIVAGREQGAMLDQIRIGPAGDLGPANAKPFVLRFNGTPVEMEAEAIGKLVGSEMKIHTEGNVRYVSAKKRDDGKRLDKPSRSRLVMLIEVEQPMRVRLHGLVKCPSGTDDNNSFFVGVAPGDNANPHNYQIWGTPQQAHWQWGVSPAMKLSAGLNTIVIAAREEGTMLDKIKISR
jgi:hypothetical protein